MANVSVIIGEDDLLVDEAARKAAGDGEGLEVIDSATATNEELQLRDLAAAEESVMTPPFLAPRKVTWWRNVRFLPGGGKAAGDAEGGGRAPGEAVKAALLAFAERLAAAPLPDTQRFILSGPRLLATSVFAKTLRRVADFTVFEKAKGQAATQGATGRALERAASLGLSFASGAEARFVARVGEDTRSLWSELDKMRDYLGPGATTITAADIDAITSSGAGVEPQTWAISDAVCARDLPGALAAIRAFEGDAGFAVMATTVIERALRQLVEMKDAEATGRLDDAARGMNPWAARKMAGALRRWTLLELRTARLRFMNLRERCVSSGGGADALVAVELVRALAPQGGRRGA